MAWSPSSLYIPKTHATSVIERQLVVLLDRGQKKLFSGLPGEMVNFDPLDRKQTIFFERPDMRHKGYKEKDAVANAWNEVAAALEFVDSGKSQSGIFVCSIRVYTYRKFLDFSCLLDRS